MINGVDISAIQGNVNFPWLKQKNYQFVMCRNYIGNDYRDSLCDTNLKKSRDTGLYAGIYNFVYPLPTNPAHPNRDPVSQANLHFNSCQGQPTAVDLEWPAPEDWSKYGCSANQINDWILTYLEKYTQLNGAKPILYTYPYFAKAVKLPSDITQYPLWIASYTAVPNIPAPYTDYYMWQTGGGNLLTLDNGSKCDTDVVKELSFFGVKSQPEPAVEPVPEITAPVQTAPTEVTNQVVTPVANNTTTTTNTLNTILETIGPAILQVIKTLLHIK